MCGDLRGPFDQPFLPRRVVDLGFKGIEHLPAVGEEQAEPVDHDPLDIAGRDAANPLATILSAAMMFRYSLDDAQTADRIEAAVDGALRTGARTADIAAPGTRTVGTVAMGDAVLEQLDAQ